MYRRFFCMVVAVFVFFTCVGTAFAEKDGQTADFVRLHVVAESDSQWDQKVKLYVRDACVILAREMMGECDDADEAYDTLRANKSDFEAAARKAAREMGYTGEVTAEIGEFDFPDRIYGELLVPAGKYRALRIVIGGGEGHNWWCVLYPSLCVLDEAVYASGDQDVEIEFYSSVARWISQLF